VPHGRLLASLTVVLALAACAGDEEAGPTGPTGSSGTSTAPPTVSTTVPPTPPVTPDTAPPGSPPTSVASTSPSPVTSRPPLRGLAYEPVVEAAFPSVLVPEPEGEGMLLAERAGVVRRLAAATLSDPVLDLSGVTTTDGERGLLGMSFHPEDPGRLFLHYTDLAGATTVSEVAWVEGRASLGTERVLVTVDQPAANHNGGMIQFGPDGALYLGLGDGGGRGDTFGNGQDAGTLLGGIVRIDVESGAASLWQLGLRNPWRFWIDGDDIWIADVGQGTYEEVDLAPIGQEGVNYGWPVTEGSACYGAAECDTTGFTSPIVAIAHGDAGTCSITGGVVYRGGAIPEVEGRFFFSDYCGGYLRSTDREGTVTDHTADVGVAGRVVSFGTDRDGEMYVLTTDRVMRVVPVR
jgi:glucose/arabinose dehydrogenase